MQRCASSSEMMHTGSYLASCFTSCKQMVRNEADLPLIAVEWQCVILDEGQRHHIMEGLLSQIFLMYFTCFTVCGPAFGIKPFCVSVASITPGIKIQLLLLSNEFLCKHLFCINQSYQLTYWDLKIKLIFLLSLKIPLGRGPLLHGRKKEKIPSNFDWRNQQNPAHCWSLVPLRP